MTSVGLLLSLLFKLVLPLALLAACIWLLVAAWRRRYAATGPLPAGAPMGSRTSAGVELIVVAAMGLVILVMTATMPNTNGLLLQLANQSRAVVVYSLVAFALAALGFVAAITFAWRGAGSTAVVVMILTLAAYGFSLNGNPYLSNLRQQQYREQRESRTDTEMLIDIGANVTGADLWANDVYLGKTPVRIKLSEFLTKVPDWTDDPRKKRPETGPDSASNAGKQPGSYWNDRWGILIMPYDDVSRRLRGPIALPPAEAESNSMFGSTAINGGRSLPDYHFARVAYDGEEGHATGSTGGGSGNGVDFAESIGFRFLAREAAIERLLDQARLADYQVDDRWMESIAKFGPDGWIAIRSAAEFEPQMQGVFDAWVRRKYSIDAARGFDGAWELFERIRQEGDAEGVYFTAAPAGRAVELLSPTLLPRLLIDASKPIVETTTNTTYVDYGDVFGNRQIAVYAEGARPISLPGNSRLQGWYNGHTKDGVGQMKPSDMAVIHAIWLANERYAHGKSSSGGANPFQTQLAPLLLRADFERSQRMPMAMWAAVKLGGPVVETFLTRMTERKRDVDVLVNYRDAERPFMGARFNRWIYWAALLPGEAGQNFRANHLDALFEMADQVAEYPASVDEVQAALPFLFTENELGAESIGRRYWPRYQEVVQRKRPYRDLEPQLSYLVCLGEAAEAEMFINVLIAAWDARPNEMDFVQFRLRQLDKLPVEKQAAVLDGLLAHIAARDQTARPPNFFEQNDLRRARYEIDDAASVAYQLKGLRTEPSAADGYLFQQPAFADRLAETASRRPMLVEALATAPEAELRLLALDALRADPLPPFQKLLPALLQYPDEKVRTAAEGVQKQWDSLRATAG
jgi:hypothetical protein